MGKGRVRVAPLHAEAGGEGASKRSALHLFLLREIQRGVVDAITQSRGPGAVVEDVAEVGVALLAQHFGAKHSVT